MSQDRLTVLRLLSYCWLTVIVPPNAFAYNVVYNKEPSSSLPFQPSTFYQGGSGSSSSSSSSSRKFGGYRIVPRACKDLTAGTAYRNDAASGGGGGGESGTGVCMFNYECTQLGGSVVGSCVDVFLFGACCRLPAGTKLPYAVDQQQSTTAAATATPGRQPSPSPSAAPTSFLHPVADTILLHRNGTAVQNAYRPDDMSAELMANRGPTRPPSGWHSRWPTSPQQDWHDRRPTPPTFSANRITTSKVDSSTAPAKQTSSSSPVSKSTDSVPNIRKTTPSAAALHHPTELHGYTDDYYDGMVLVPTLTVHDPNAKTPVENNSIHHILSILNQTPPTNGGGDDDDDPLDTSPSYQHTQHSSSTSPPGLYTWGSIEGDTKTPGYGSPATFPVTRPVHHHASPPPAYYQHYDRPAANGGLHYGGGPSTPATTTTTTTATSTHHLPGPHFHVLATTARPPEVDPVVPTVIVLSSANDKNPNKYSTTTAVYTSSSSYRPPPSHVKPSQSIIVTGKPSVSAAYTTTATYHHHQVHNQAGQQQQQQQQQNLAFVPVSSTTLADHYYNTNNYNVQHTSTKPAAQSSTNYGHRPPTTTTTTTSLPPTLSSTVHQDGINNNNNNNNNNVFTTVITSVNHQYHKYQPTAATSTVARPVLNSDSMAVVSPGGYRPYQTIVTTAPADDDYPSPVVTPSPQVYITATDVHQHHQQQQQHTSPPSSSSSSYPGVGSLDDDDNDDDNDVGTVVTAFNSTDTFAFPPVRDPNVNLTAVVTQQEKPIAAAGVDGDYDADADPNPQLMADDNLDDKVHLFVEKVVQSLQGNFEDLERVLLSGDQSSNVSVGLSDEQPPPNKKPTTTTRKPPRPATAKPPAAKPTKPSKPTTTSSTYRPTPITLPLDAAPYLELTTTASRPTKVPALLTPVQLFQPTTYTAKPPTKQPVRVTPSTTVVLDQLNVEHDHTTAEPDYRKVCGVRPLVRKNGRIVGGTGSTFGEWPWQVLVREATWLGLFTKNKCGGVLITQKHVITAAHCQPGFLANLVAVFGEYDISGEVESKRSVSKNVKRVIVHRQYDQATFENDIALLELESPVSYDQHIVPICMPDDDDDFTGRMASVTGWGRLKYGGGVPSVLQEVQVPIIENQVCQDMFETAGHSKAILSSFLCAGYANGQRDSCEGDSGGPLMIEKDNGRWTLVGTVSHGIKCAAPYLPGVYMRTTYYKPWLQTITGVQ